MSDIFYLEIDLVSFSNEIKHSTETNDSKQILPNPVGITKCLSKSFTLISQKCLITE